LNSFRHFGGAHRKVSAYAGQHSTQKRRHISMPQAGFEPPGKEPLVPLG